MTMQARCSCGAVVLEIERPPEVRIVCHCTICQKANKGPYGDIATMRPKHVQVSGDVDWRRYKSFPVSVRRGFCKSCDDLIVEHFWPAAIGFTIVPVSRFVDQGALPARLGHIFYETRVADMDDDLPKIEGFVRSQLAATRWMLPLYGS